MLYSENVMIYVECVRIYTVCPSKIALKVLLLGKIYESFCFELKFSSKLKYNS